MTETPPRGPTARTVSIVRLEGDEWFATNDEDPSIAHHAASLTDLLAAHRHAVAFRLRKELDVRYLLGDADTVERIARIRAAGVQVAALRREANHAESTIRAERLALMWQLAALRVTPREIALIVGVPTTAVPKDLETGRDASRTRAVTIHPLPPDDPAGAGRLF